MASSEGKLKELVENWEKNENRTVLKWKDTTVRENGRTFILRDITAR